MGVVEAGDFFQRKFGKAPRHKRTPFYEMGRAVGRQVFPTRISDNPFPPDAPPAVGGGPCSSHPCYGGGTCEEHDGTFTCFCPSDRTGDRCEKRLAKSDVEVPSFDDRAFVELRPLPKVEHKFSLEVEFRPLAADGVILFAQQSLDGTGDFISLALRGGRVEFRYELGDGPALLRSRSRVQLGRWHRVQARRWHRDGMLRLDTDAETVEGASPGELRSLDVPGPAYVGAPPPRDELTGAEALERVLDRLGLPSADAGFRGCVRRFSLGVREMKVQSSSDPMVVQRSGLAECGSSPCEGVPCRNGGKCHADTGGTYFSCR